MNAKFNYKNLIVYQTSTKFLSMTLQVISEIPYGYGFLIDQLRRAALSVPLNIAEGSGKFGKKEQARFYLIARGSANECSAIFDILEITQLVKKENCEKVQELLYEIVCMLSKMAC